MVQKGDWSSEESQGTGKQEGRGSRPGTLGTRNVQGMRTQLQSIARLEQTEAEDLALLTTLGVTVPPRRLVWLSVSTYQQNFTLALLQALEWEISSLVVNHKHINFIH